MNRYPLWKYVLLVALVILGFFYAAPNMFGEDPAIQISQKGVSTIDPALADRSQQALNSQNIPYRDVQNQTNAILIRFPNTDAQLKALDTLKATLGEDYTVALNLAPRTPKWMTALGAHPMKLGLDLRGGVNFLLAVDLNSVLKARLDGDLQNTMAGLRENNIRYAGASVRDGQLNFIFRDSQTRNAGLDWLRSRFPDYIYKTSDQNGQFALTAQLSPVARTNLLNYAVDQNMNILSKKVNELGISEAVVQRQGEGQISIDLPGVADTAQAKDIVGKVDTLRFQLVDMDNDVQAALAGNVPLGSRLYNYEGRPYLLKNQVILTGNAITYATAVLGEDGRPAVSIRLGGGGGETTFTRMTAENINKLLAVVYVETVPQTQMVNGKPVTTHKQKENVISIATIRSALPNSFQIQGLSDMHYAQDLALSLRSGALTAPVDIIQERTIGPTLGAANIHKGILSVLVGSAAVVIFMILYYQLFGLVANIALLLNIVFIIAILSILGGTLTLPGIAGIVLTVGIGVDANVLIFERIREELRNGLGIQASIHTGYEKAFATIIDANVTTLIVTMILFALGSGAVKSFAVTLTIGILTSLITAIFVTRSIINLIYGGRPVKKISIGIKMPSKTVAQKGSA